MRRQVVIAFIIFMFFGGMVLSGCHIVVNYLLAELFFNDRFITAILDNFDSLSTTAIFLIENFVIAGIVAICPCISLYQSKKITVHFVLFYSCVLYIIDVFCVAIYLNLARSAFSLGGNLFYVLMTPFFDVIVPIWLAYMVYYFYSLAHSGSRT